ncbi:hypothetical protein [Acetobacter orientalis]|uniref:hypothetical protein n=1 Tax=Acetobacter orientalis TaxID=146474 RepID=UPI0006629BF0|nr:hypothetical protein [Acetobacter orientalis]
MKKFSIIGSNKKNIVIILLFALFVVFRLPNVVLQGRFLAEEGAVFFAYAWHFPAWKAVWRPFAGYLNLGANASTALDASLVKAGWVSLENAPYVTTGIAFFFQMQAAVIILWGKADWLCGKYIKPALLFVIAFCPFSEEVWLNVMHIQYQLILCCGLILAINTPKNFWVWFYQALLLVLAPLCGPGAIVLGPLFLLRSIIDKSVSRMCQTIFLGLGSIVQLFLFFSPSVVRGHFLNPLTLCSILFVRTGVYPILGSSISRRIGQIIIQSYNENGLLWYSFSLISVCYFLFLLYISWRYRNISAGWLLVSGFLLAVVSFGGGMISSDANSWFDGKDGERYNFIPLVFFEMALLIITSNVSKNYRTILKVLCVVMLLVCVSSYIKPIGIVRSGPDWKQQVQLWRGDHMRPLEIWGWPISWAMNLSDITLSCPAVSLKAASYEDPTYCETNWIAHVLGLPHNK